MLMYLMRNKYNIVHHIIDIKNNISTGIFNTIAQLQIQLITIEQ